MDNSDNRQGLPNDSNRPDHPNRPGRIPIATLGLDTSGSPFGLPDLPLPFHRTGPARRGRYRSRDRRGSPRLRDVDRSWERRPARPAQPFPDSDSSVSSDSDVPTYEEELQAELAWRAFRQNPSQHYQDRQRQYYQNRPRPDNGVSLRDLSPNTRGDLQDHRLLARDAFDRYFANRRPPVFRPVVLSPLPQPAGTAARRDNSPPSRRDSTRPSVGSHPGSRSATPPLVTPPRATLWSDLVQSSPSDSRPSQSSPGTPPGSLDRRDPVVDRLAEQFSQLGACGGSPAPAWTLPRELEHTIRPLDPRRQEDADDRRTRIEKQSRILFHAILAVKERNPESNADQLWLDFVAELVKLGAYDNGEDVRSAWHFVFREPPRPLFAYLVTGSFETTVERVTDISLFRQGPLEED